MTFTKLFSSITESTIWVEPDPVRIVWITMLAMADRRGRVWGSIPGLANRARVDVEECRSAVTRFLSPDADSRTKENDGRRIEEIDGGWKLLNYEKYRAVRDEESIKESKRKYINTRRAKERGVENVEQSRSPSIQAEAEAFIPEEPKTAHAGFIFEFCKAYEERFGTKYEVQGAKDGSAVKRLLKFGTTPDLIGIAKRAWGENDWACQQARTIAGFASQWNQINAKFAPKRNGYQSYGA